MGRPTVHHGFTAWNVRSDLGITIHCLNPKNLTAVVISLVLHFRKFFFRFKQDSEFYILLCFSEICAYLPTLWTENRFGFTTGASDLLRSYRRKFIHADAHSAMADKGRTQIEACSNSFAFMRGPRPVAALNSFTPPLEQYIKTYTWSEMLWSCEGTPELRCCTLSLSGLPATVMHDESWWRFNHFMQLN